MNQNVIVISLYTIIEIKHHFVTRKIKNLQIHRDIIIFGKGGQTKHLTILRMSVLYRSEQGTCTASPISLGSLNP